jgi:hypothetical protein
MMRTRTLALLPLLVLALVAIAAAGALTARANGVPQLVKLEYIPGVSNFGPRDAEGVLEFSFAERYARASVKNLVPEPGYTYEGWMKNDEGNAFAVGTFDIDADGIGSLESRLDALDSYDYNLFVVAARGQGDPAGELPDNIAIGGTFTVIEAPGEGTTPSPADTRPNLLPETGAPAGSGGIDPVWGAFTAMTVAGLLIVVFGFIRKRRSASD